MVALSSIRHLAWFEARSHHLVATDLEISVSCLASVSPIIKKGSAYLLTLLKGTDLLSPALPSSTVFPIRPSQRIKGLVP